ncbi:MAG: sigma-70 family RNA polymerase sigma factor [Myxococcales bacterium]|nr:sigma-70 family RNA polymerase sigma factor [Myxococcales bacterium]MCB9626629.1 sigma-70 family RNA polymerase sigma factor [Sandaracinaceae bacterium]
MSTSTTTLRLVEPIDRSDYDASVRPHVPELYGTAVRLTRSRTEADDLLQDTLARAWVFWHRFQKGTNARAWMHRILMNTFITSYRRRRREREIMERVALEAETLPSPALTLTIAEDASPRDSLGDEVRAALDTIRPEFRSAVELVDVEERSYQEAAELLGCPIGTIMSRLHRGRRALREQLRTYAFEEGYVSELVSSVA